MFNIIDETNKKFEMLNSRVTPENFNASGYNSTYNPTKIQNCFKVQDLRILSDRSVFEEYDALRKTYQYDKDFINDQDSVQGVSIVNNMIKNILCTQLGTLDSDPFFGVDLNYHMFEQLDWVGIIGIRDHIASQLDVNLPQGVEVHEVDIQANPDGLQNTVQIDIIYSTNTEEEFRRTVQSGPGSSLDTKKVTFTLGIEGFTGFESPNRTQFRRAV